MSRGDDRRVTTGQPVWPADQTQLLGLAGGACPMAGDNNTWPADSAPAQGPPPGNDPQGSPGEGKRAVQSAASEQQSPAMTLEPKDKRPTRDSTGKIQGGSRSLVGSLLRSLARASGSLGAQRATRSAELVASARQRKTVALLPVQLPNEFQQSSAHSTIRRDLNNNEPGHSPPAKRALNQLNHFQHHHSPTLGAKGSRGAEDEHKLIDSDQEEEDEEEAQRQSQLTSRTSAKMNNTNTNTNNNNKRSSKMQIQPTDRGSKQTSSPASRRLMLGFVGILGPIILLLVVSVASTGAQNSGFAGAGRQVSPVPVVGPNQAAAHQHQRQPVTPVNPQPAAGSLVANVNCNKVRAQVSLTPSGQGGASLTAHVQAGPPGEVYQWAVHQFPVKPGSAMCSCSPLILGAKLIDFSELHGNLASEGEFRAESPGLQLFGADSPVGHSLLLRGMKTGMLACATFLPTSRKSNYRAKFHSPLSGSVTIFQTAFGTSFISHLMYSNGTRRHSVHRFDLLRSDEDIVTSPLAGLAAQAGSAGQGSSLMEVEQREHDMELSQCRRASNMEPLFRNSSLQLAVSTENFGMRGRTALVLPHVPFESLASVYVVVYSEHEGQEPLACAPLRFVKPKSAAAKFQTNSVQGSVLFSQESPYDATVARINLNLPNSDGHSYGIDELPMIIRRKSDTRVCPNIREIIYNPHHVEPSTVPGEGEATSDQYAVGDLSGKYGSLAGKSSEKLQTTDYNLPLFGPASIVGRAMTIYSAEGVAIACSNVELTSPMTTAFATFDFGIQGQFIFRQPVNDCNGDTYVYIEVSKPVSSSGQNQRSSSSSEHNNNLDHHSRSSDHNWHIHTNPVDSGADHLSTTECGPAGGHFNPYNTSTSGIYTRDCTPFNVLRCELGDLSSKTFTLEIPPYRVKGAQEPDIGKFFSTDIDLPLCGPVSIVNRSVVVHVADFGVQRLACSTVIEFKPRT